MIVVALTGSIGMGKSVLAAQFRHLKIPVHEADATVHTLLSPGGAAQDKVKKMFPVAVKGGQLDRRKLGALVFNDPAARKKLESILHPLVRADRKNFLKSMRLQGQAIAVIDVPLLFETGVDKLADHIVCATAPRLVQEARVLSRPGMTMERLRAVRALQIPDAVKRKKSDTVINTARGYSATYGDIKKLVAKLLAAPKQDEDDEG